jgi:hypothetical protein
LLHRITILAVHFFAMATYKIYNHPYDRVFKKCELALGEFGVEVEYSNCTDGCIQGSISGSLLSWGEDVEIVVKSLGHNQTKVTITSEAKAQVFSWGKNDANEQSFFDTLDRFL